MGKLNLFVKEFIALINGDTDEVEAIKAWRGAESALKVQIALKEAETVRLEDNLERAKEKLKKARVNNGKVVGENLNGYIDQLISAANAVTAAEESLENHHANLNFLKGEYDSLKQEVPE